MAPRPHRPRRRSASNASAKIAKIRALADSTNDKETVLVPTKKRRIAASSQQTSTAQAKFPELKIANASPLVFHVITKAIDQFNNGTDSIVNVNGFVEECKRIDATTDSLKEAIGNAALSLGFISRLGMEKSSKPQMHFYATLKYSGQAFLPSNSTHRLAVSSWKCHHAVNKWFHNPGRFGIFESSLRFDLSSQALQGSTVRQGLAPLQS